ncbi:GTPase [Glaciimonas sp. CA11.2]|uniref:GTPase n=1 Tax=Glaciimonas sp. CA11.2 TaxID=3048601 RepID=UPI002AB57130|nr:GTPase [Glaciimonas sp. CA11.2]MDY7546640.1 GTPase [Glaciimonas sp. CA11.2]MEB0161894.1 GTPase [Glaciimonas sp. CA11.2]
MSLPSQCLVPPILSSILPPFLTLVTGPSATRRESAVWLSIKTEATSLQQMPGIIGVILEGLPDGKSPPEPTHFTLHIKRVAPGCLCCIGLLTLRVTLNRLLRDRPARLYISIADATHIDKIRALLSTSPYDEWLTLTDDIAT